MGRQLEQQVSGRTPEACDGVTLVKSMFCADQADQIKGNVTYAKRRVLGRADEHAAHIVWEGHVCSWLEEWRAAASAVR